LNKVAGFLCSPRTDVLMIIPGNSQ
jgi:hypothetical protein